MEFYAHEKRLPDGEIVRQTVWEHVTNAADRAAQCLHSVGLEKAAYLAGLLHDTGKYTVDFQEYLSKGDPRKRGSVVHTFQGCRYLLERHHREAAGFSSLAASELIAFAVGAHHGLFDCVDPHRQIGLQYRMDKEDSAIAYSESMRNFFLQGVSESALDQLFREAAEEINRVLGKMENLSDEDYCFQSGLLARLLLSAVMEGDRWDTAIFMKGTAPVCWPKDVGAIWEERLSFLQKKLAHFSSDGSVAQARHQISEICCAFAQKPSGIYQLNVPTGGGKTLSSLRYALAHAKQYHKKRLIFVSPLLSIIEQNARVIREFVGEDRMILEHHSNVVQVESDQNELDQRELLVQSWDSPIVITTMVQLLNTLFDGKTTSIRRFWALCDSVIVIDEVQTVPSKMLTLFNCALSFLRDQCGATIILCSATQPGWDKAHHPLKPSPEDMVPYDPKIWDAFRRTELRPVEDRRLDEFPDFILEQMETADSLLVVCNKKSEASYLLEQTRSADYRSFHLSAGMCVQHRRDMLEELKGALNRKEKVLCISTQVIEAGVDISFGRVIRLTAGMDSIVQAAGRCNRNGENAEPQPVYAVNCCDEKLGKLRDIQRGKDATLELIEKFREFPERFGGSLFSNEAIQYFYEVFYREMKEREQDYYIPDRDATLYDLMGCNTCYADEDCRGGENFFLRQAFRTAGECFCVFDESTTDVLVPYRDAKRLIAELGSERCRFDASYRDAILKEMNPYTVSLYPYQKKLLEESHAIHSVCDDCVLVLAGEFYREEIGLVLSADPQEFWEV